MSRAKKTILLVDADEWRASLRSFLFETRGFHVIKSSNALTAVENITQTVDLVACNISEDEVRTVAKKAKIVDPEIPVWLVGDEFSSEQLVQHAKIMCSRKRGPKKAA